MDSGLSCLNEAALTNIHNKCLERKSHFNLKDCHFKAKLTVNCMSVLTCKESMKQHRIDNFLHGRHKLNPYQAHKYQHRPQTERPG